ncbi:MAG: hypothetical protein HYY24_04905 [Verrucomicrobia bacterium]|nr:hypothetical protein [Verrucomicrobiota bacterium]
MLLRELSRQPEAVAQKLLDYLHAIAPPAGESDNRTRQAPSGHFAGYWHRFYGAFDGEAWDEPRELQNEHREEW